MLGYDLLMAVVIPGGRPLNPGKKRDSEKDTSALMLEQQFSLTLGPSQC